MKVAIICVLALASLVNGQDGIRGESNDEFGTWSRNQVCTPGATKMEDCNSCFCIGDGSGWGCTEMACPPKLAIQKPLDRAD